MSKGRDLAYSAFMASRGFDQNESPSADSKEYIEAHKQFEQWWLNRKKIAIRLITKGNQKQSGTVAPEGYPASAGWVLPGNSIEIKQEDGYTHTSILLSKDVLIKMILMFKDNLSKKDELHLMRIFYS